MYLGGAARLLVPSGPVRTLALLGAVAERLAPAALEQAQPDLEAGRCLWREALRTDVVLGDAGVACGGVASWEDRLLAEEAPIRFASEQHVVRKGHRVARKGRRP